jgi:fatty-acyl-CoA synthase
VGADHEAVVECASGRRLSYGELLAEVDACALGMHERGVRVGDRVGLWSPNRVEWVVLLYAVARLGAILVNLNPAHRSDELVSVVQRSGISLLVVAPDSRTEDRRPVITTLRAGCPGLREVIFLDDPDWADLLAAGRRGDRALLVGRQRQLSADDPVDLQYTSASRTRSSRGATLSHHNLVNNAFFVGSGCGYTADDRVCVPVPFFHCFGLGMGVLGALTHGATLIIPAPEFDPALTLRAVRDESCTSLYGVPAMFAAELALCGSGADRRSLRTGVVAGSPCPAELMEQMVAELGLTEVTVCHGMSETSPVVTQTRRDDDLRLRTTTVGRVHPHLEVKIIEPTTGLTVDRGEPGELCVRGYAVMLGYWDAPADTAAVIDGARWFHTGDLAVLDSDDLVTVVGRIDEWIVRGGEHVDPREVEAFLSAHPDVVDVRVIGVPDERFGEEVMAWLRLRPGAPVLTAKDLRAFAGGRAAHHLVPRYVRVVDDFPQPVSGHLPRVDLRNLSITELGLERAAGLQHR